MLAKVVLSIVAALTSAAVAHAQDRTQPDISEILRDVRERTAPRSNLELIVERDYSLPNREQRNQYAIRESKKTVRCVIQPNRFRVETTFSGTTIGRRSRSYSQTAAFDGVTTRYSGSGGSAEKSGPDLRAVPAPEVLLCPREPSLTLSDWLEHGKDFGTDNAGENRQEVEFESVEPVLGVTCVRILLSSHTKKEPVLRTDCCRLWLAAERGYAVAQIEKMKRAEDGLMIVTGEGKVTRWLELPDASWIPAEGFFNEFEKGADGERQVLSTEKFVVRQASLNPTYADAFFNLESKSK